jgi:hypothetical protein
VADQARELSEQRSMNADPIFTRADTWDGGSFELRLFYEPYAADTLAPAFATLWAHPSLDGCVADRFPAPAQQPRVSPAVAARERGRLWYGVATLPNGVRVGCLSLIFLDSESDDPLEIRFGIPMGALARAYPVGAYPFTDGKPLTWRAEVSAWLVEIAGRVFAEHPFRFGMIDHEATMDGVTPGEVNEVPAVRWEGYLWPEGDHLAWYPQTESAAIDLGRPETDAGRSKWGYLKRWKERPPRSYWRRPC